MRDVTRIGDKHCSGDQGFIHKGRPMTLHCHLRDTLITSLPQAGRR